MGPPAPALPFLQGFPVVRDLSLFRRFQPFPDGADLPFLDGDVFLDGACREAGFRAVGGAGSSF